MMAEMITFIVIVYTGFKQNEHIRSYGLFHECACVNTNRSTDCINMSPGYM